MAVHRELTDAGSRARNSHPASDRETLFECRRATFRFTPDEWHRGVAIGLLGLDHWHGYEPMSVVSEERVSEDGVEYIDATIWFRRAS